MVAEIRWVTCARGVEQAGGPRLSLAKVDMTFKL